MKISFAYCCLALLACFAVVAVSGCGSEAREASMVDSAKNTHRYQAPLASMEEISGTEESNTESYDVITENEFVNSLTNPKSTFSIDVDTASYSNVRRFINERNAPPKGAVRIEELINYFDYQYADPESEHPFSVQTDLGKCPWNEDHQLVRIGLKGKSFPPATRPNCNLVFLMDVSGSMGAANKLPLVKKALKMLVKNLDDRDRISIVVYAGASGLVLPSTSASDEKAITYALDGLKSGGSTNGGQGIQLAYQVAAENYIENGVNRVVLCTDGDFNVGVSSKDQLVELIKDKAKSGVALSVLGFGTGNFKDDSMESLADCGNGNYAYIDSELEAKKALVEQLSGTLITIAKDVKVQVDFNPARVQAYRLIGYENRMLKNEDFADDKKDAGEIGAGHTVTALYEVVPTGVESPARTDSGSEFVETTLKSEAANSETVLRVHLRYKQPEESESQSFSVALDHAPSAPVLMPSGDFQFAASVAAYGMLLRDSKFKGAADWEMVLRAAKDSIGSDKHGYRSEFVKLARQASMLR